MRKRAKTTAAAVIWAVSALHVGCASPQMTAPSSFTSNHEGTRRPLAEYVVNPPDQLVIQMEAAATEKQLIEPGDTLAIDVPKAPADNPITGNFLVGGDGNVDLKIYGRVRVVGLTAIQAKEAIEKHLKKDLPDPKATVVLAGVRTIAGEYLIRPDGRVQLGFFGTVFIGGLTLTQAEQTIREHLETEYGLVGAKLSVDVATYNSAVYYIISDGGAFGDQVTKLPITGHETVLDAVSEIGGLPQAASKTNMWIARPVADDPLLAEILPVDWYAISKHGAMATNYQIQPGDRLYVKADKLIAADSTLGKILAPIERILGTITLFDITVKSVQRGPNVGFSNQNP